jgi:hypothetical protein
VKLLSGSPRNWAWAIYLPCLALTTNAQTPTPESNAKAVIARLLSDPVPPPDWREHLKKRKPTPQAKPPADGPTAELVHFWRSAEENEVPDDATRSRLLEACEAKPEQIDGLLPRLALDSPAVQERLKKLYDRLVAERRSDDSSRIEALRDALMTHGSYFRDELIRRVFFPDDVNEPHFQEATAAFLRLDREGAKQLFLKKSTSSDLQHRVLALSNLREHFAAETEPRIVASWQDALKQIVSDPKSTRRPRGFALASLMSGPTSENDEWFLELFRDRTLQEIEQYSSHTTLLADIVAGRPDYWIPKIVPLVTSKDPAVHTNAVLALIHFQIDRARADALRPLLPWLANPQWAPQIDRLHGRLRLIQSLDRVDLPEAVPGLLKVVETDSEWELAGAAEALAHYNAREAGEPLRRALKREKEEHHRRTIVRALLKLGALSVEEMVRALKSYAVKMSTPEGQKEVEAADDLSPKKQLDSQVSLGRELSRSELSDDKLSAELSAEAKRLSMTNPRAADILQQFVARWQTPSAIKAIVDRLRSGDFTADWVKQLIEQRTRLAEPLSKVHDFSGAALGIQAALINESNLVNHVLDSSDRLAQLALLAVARLGRIELPVATIANWLSSTDQQLARAAELYLEANDSAEARAQIWRLAPGAAKILGARWYFDPGHVTFGAFDQTEAKLRDAVLGKNGPDAIYALLSEGYWGGNGQRVLFAEHGKTILRGDDGNGRTRECEIPEAEMKALVDWLESQRIEDLPPFDTGTADGIQWEFVRLNRDGGRRIFMNNPPFGGGAPRVEFGDAQPSPDPAIYGELTRRFTDLTERPMQVVYRNLTELPGYNVVHSREKGEVVAIRKEKDQLVAGIRLPSEKATAWHRVTESGLSLDFVIEKIKENTSDDYDIADAVEVHEGPLSGKTLFPKRVVSLRQEEGLWAVGKDGNDELIAKGNFGQPVVSAGGDWIVVSRTPPGKMWDVPNSVFRIHLPDKKMTAVDLPPAENFSPLAWIVAHQRVLLYRQRDDPKDSSRTDKPRPDAGPENPEFYLLNPKTGEHEQIEGDFRPVRRLEGHALQPTGKPNEFWAVITEKEDLENPTAVLGKYDTEQFRFTPVLRFPEMWFHSWDCFVDANNQQVWLAVNGDLLRVALPNDSTPMK